MEWDSRQIRFMNNYLTPYPVPVCWVHVNNYDDVVVAVTWVLEIVVGLRRTPDFL